MLLLNILDTYIYPGPKPILKISTQGHTFLTMVVSFLLVSRVTTALNRYNAARECLGTMYREARELVQEACVLSRTDASAAAKEWRNELCYRTLALLRTAMAVVDYPDTSIPAWTVPELNGDELADVKENLLVTSKTARRWAHREDRSEWEESMRVPIRIAYLLRTTVHSQNERLATPMPTGQENRLLACASSFNSGYYGIRKFLTTVRSCNECSSIYREATIRQVSLTIF